MAKCWIENGPPCDRFQIVVPCYSGITVFKMVALVLCFVTLPTTTLIKKTMHVVRHVVRLRLHPMMCLGSIRVMCWNAIYSFSPSYERATHHIYIQWTLSLLWLESGHLNSRSVVICQPGFCAIHALFPTHWPACSRICLNICWKAMLSRPFPPPHPLSQKLPPMVLIIRIIIIKFCWCFMQCNALGVGCSQTKQWKCLSPRPFTTLHL